MAIDVKIKKKIGDFLLDVSFSSEEEVFALLGSSGSGKSMTLKCIAGIERPDEGHIIVNGRVLFDSEQKINLPAQKRNVGYMFQDYALFPNMTVVENIKVGMGKYPNAKKVEQYIRQFQLEGLEDRLPKQISGGQKQRVALARMLASEPEILLMDEPLSALDSYLRWQMEEELLELLRQVKKTVIYVTHSRDEVYHLCDRVCVLERGSVEVIKEKKAFFQDPETLAAARISGCRNYSRVERISDYVLNAIDWGMELTLERQIPEDITYAGVRAHYIEILEGERDLTEGQKNQKVFRVDHLFEQQFESELVLDSETESQTMLRLLLDKEKALRLSKEEVLKVHIPEKALLLLK